MRQSRIRHIFAYGTLMTSDCGPRGARERATIAALCTLVGPARIRGTMFDTGPYPGVVLAAGAGDLVHGELWRLPDEPGDRCALIDVLERYEGCAAGSPEPHPYARCALRVAAPGGRRVTAWVYLWIAPTVKLPRIADGRWLSARRQAPHAEAMRAAGGLSATSEA